MLGTHKKAALRRLPHFLSDFLMSIVHLKDDDILPGSVLGHVEFFSAVA
jgi:hypothetical protein